MKSLFYLFFAVLFFGCSRGFTIPGRQIVQAQEPEAVGVHSYKGDSSISTPQGFARQGVSYFHIEDFRGIDPAGRIFAEAPYEHELDLAKVPGHKIKRYHELSQDSSLVESLSELLFRAQEPVLSNFYTGAETYRFVWERSFWEDYIFRLCLEEKDSKLYTTKIKALTGKRALLEKKISTKQFAEFRKMLNQGNFWAMPPYEWERGFDGSLWTLEAHTQRGYKLMSRYRPALVYEDELLLRQLG